ncbi:MAG: HD domain-containing phosphohydrolase [Gammaproteobacteria bacterium]
MNEQILFVDDEPNVLRSIQRSMRKRYILKTADSGKHALEIIEQEGPFAVIVSDMQMPEMNGAELLSKVRELSPHTVRIILTGNADQQTAVDAINQGDILRFLNKPTSSEEIANAVDAGLKQHRLIKAEEELLEKTLKDSIQVLTDILALANPEIFGRCSRIKARTIAVIRKLGFADSWEFESMAMLSQIGCVSLQSDLMKKIHTGKRLTDQERLEFAGHASSGAQLIGKIPRMESIAETIRYQRKNFDGSGSPRDDVKGEQIPLGARILRAVIDLDVLVAAGHDVHEALSRMRKAPERYDPRVFEALECSQSPERSLRKVHVENLTSEMQLADDLSTSSGALLVAMGQATTSSVRNHLMTYSERGMIDAELEVWVTD